MQHYSNIIQKKGKNLICLSDTTPAQAIKQYNFILNERGMSD